MTYRTAAPGGLATPDAERRVLGASESDWPKRLEPMPLPNSDGHSLPLCVMRMWLWIGGNAGRYSHVRLHFVLPAPPPLPHVAGTLLIYVFSIPWLAYHLMPDPCLSRTRDHHPRRAPGRKEGLLARSGRTPIFIIRCDPQSHLQTSDSDTNDLVQDPPQ